MLRAVAPDAPTVVFSVLGVLWVPFVYLVRQRSDLLPLMVGGMVAMGALTFITFDMTRVYALLTWPVVLVAALWFADNEPELARRWAAWLCVAAVIVPRVMVWYSGPYVSSWGRAWRVWF